jgi:quercetin dioxygenase-like cupin family protein
MNNYQPSMIIVPKSWGDELIVVNKKEYCGKILTFKKDSSCSVHFHKSKDETFFLTQGRLIVNFYDLTEEEKNLDLESLKNVWKEKYESRQLISGDNFYIPPYRVHQMCALEQSQLIEFSTESHDSDSYRVFLSSTPK